MSAPAAQPRNDQDLIPALKHRLAQAQQKLRAGFEARPLPATLLRGRAKLVDRTLGELWRHCALPRQLALVATGGYGRGELYPCSDVDLLLLLPGEIDAATKNKIEQFIGLLWDIGLDIGHSARTVDECLAEAERDITVQTTLLEARPLRGNRPLYATFEQRLWQQLDVPVFFKAKRLEQEERYTRYNDTPYSLEPNCKESPGGLRDLQTILWISRAAATGDSWPALARHGLITAAEARQLKQVQATLENIRIRLHYLAGRREDRLAFDFQEALAEQFGLQRTAARRASELLMQRYYRNAKTVTQLNTILLQNLGAAIFAAVNQASLPVNERFRNEHELLDVTSEDVFEKCPAALLESFLLLQQHPELKGMTARTLRALWRARELITPSFRRDPAHRALFLQILRQPRGLVHALRRMNQYDVLGRYLPAFGRIVGQMQHDLFHVYTVDQHILQVIRNLRRFTMSEFAHEYPLCTRLIMAFEQHWLLYVAALFHDIAKGRGGDHSQLGRQDARQFCREHGLSAEDTGLIVFLVEHHLTMSSVAQKSDLSDPDVIGAFALKVKSERRLIALYLLTVADIRGTSPKVWNAWKGKLLEDLLTATLRLLRGATPQAALGIAERQEDARSMLRFHGLRTGIEAELWRELDTAYFLRHDAETIAWQTRALYHQVQSKKPLVKARLNPIGEGLQVMVYTPDRRELFVRLCAFFSTLGYSIADAKIHTTRHNYALDSFELLDPAHLLGYRDMIGLIEHDLAARLEDQAPPDKPAMGRLSRQVKHFPITPEVSIRPDEKGSQHVLSVTAADRPGLLFAIAQVLARHNINLHTAKIATLGERVEDTFLLSGTELAQTSTLLRIETELLQALQV